MEKILNMLQTINFSFEILQHDRSIRSAQEGAEYFGIETGQTAPTLIVRTDKGFFALIVSGNRGRLDFTRVAEILGCTRAQMASPEEVKQQTGFTVGSVPVVGLPLPCVMDRQLFRYPFIYGGTGQPNLTLKIEPAALEKLNDIVAFFD
jgi:Cys-tRNA(Pro)/Cys-tRNA(Cys) deacylase